ncbi:hypothetical protein ER308_03355 [Egibacter rhizosphaerae]|uniref:SAP domain-containing protein n=1 Tax=Egibacter rhizosphaerae TaxID=1670831 RepID=A0A411YL19_9ACTN|nr:gas vesicle protein GvpO [Egibacter rhizosphaerae]QBI21886.1 hypothetical protein ER308_03355 [Egibacter rhizosphaerae]
MSYQDQTKAELKEELHRRDLRVSGTKHELVERLQGDDRDAERGGASASSGASGGSSAADQSSAQQEGSAESAPQRSGSSSSQGRARLKPLQLTRAAARQLEQLSGRRVDGTSGLEQTEEGSRVLLELVESQRVPPATDVLGTYEVVVDEYGDLVRYERLNRYIRGQVGGGQ